MKQVREDALGWQDEWDDLLRVGSMVRAGMPVAADDLRFDEWEFLGIAQEEADRADLRLHLISRGAKVD